MESEPRVDSAVERLRSRLHASLGERYDVGERLGSGGTGTVFAARDLKHDRPVALKVLRPEFTENVGSERFLREIRFAARLSHPHLVPVHDSGEADGLLYYVMPVMEGESLRALLDREGPLPVDRAVRIAREIADGLAHAHARGIVHRDVKPGNILLSGGHAVLADFGIARAIEAAHETLTQTGLAVGTPGYMSPEQISTDVSVDERSDIYSLACVLFEMLTGHPPFGGRSMAAVYAGQVRDGARSPRELRAEIPHPVDEIVTRALALRPEDRFHDVAELRDALAATDSPPRDRRLTALAVVLALALVGSLVVPRFLSSDDLSDQAGSVVVLPFGDAIQSEAETELAIDLADELTRQLNRWDSVRAVPQISLAGVRFDLGIRDAILTRPDDGLRTARMVGVDNLLAVHVRIRGDSADVTATRFSVNTGREAGRPLESRGPTDDPFRLAAAVTHQVLGLTGSVDEIERLRRQSSNAQALIDYERGVEALEGWRLGEAETHLRSAVALDSTFAMAHHHLALTLYWQGAGRTGGMSRLGPEASRASRAALRHGEDLPTRERDHVVSLNRFLEGDYAAARAGYSNLLQRDSTDVHAWLLQGIVEFSDPWLERGTDGELHPRGDLAVASRSFVETTRLSPGFHLGYGHLFDITERVVSAATGGGTHGYRIPDDELIPPWERATSPEDLEAFAPVFLDSIITVPSEDLSSLPTVSVGAGALELLESSLATLRRWSAYAPEAARPLDELAFWTARQHDLLGTPQSPGRLDSIAGAALTHLERALALRADTLPDDRAFMAVLLAAVGRRDEALSRLVEAADATDQELPRYAINPYVGAGDPAAALALMARENPPRVFWMDSTTMAMVHDGGLFPLVRRLQILAASGAGDAEIEAAFRRIDERLAAPVEGQANLPRLRARFAGWLAPALARTPVRLETWVDPDTQSDPLWRAIDPSQPDRAGAIREAAEVEDPEVGEPERSWLLGSAALEVGDAPLAHRLLARIDSVPPTLLARDPGWGFVTLARFRRGEALDALGDSVAAVAEFTRFLESRPGDDSSEWAVYASGRSARGGG